MISDITKQSNTKLIYSASVQGWMQINNLEKTNLISFTNNATSGVSSRAGRRQTGDNRQVKGTFGLKWKFLGFNQVQTFPQLLLLVGSWLVDERQQGQGS